MHGFRWTGAGGVRLWLWGVATVVREAGAQGGDGEGSVARQKSSDDEGSATRQKSSDGKGNASMHGLVYFLTMWVPFYIRISLGLTWEMLNVTGTSQRCFIYNVLIRMNKFLAKLNKLDWKSKQKLNAQIPILRAPPKWKRERKVATARAVLHGRRAATARGMPQCMLASIRFDGVQSEIVGSLQRILGSLLVLALLFQSKD
ncbi:unnamed protein product [Miscanthus lutarioriparius]|uniref:Uncharacterized protein n=1 Tax=Miscanthus lutarioriparius TaxID=422564 RepID=A0A811NLE3_9POAL|nr:unnamed protein product [Miscanthus lutarioriparius]